MWHFVVCKPLVVREGVFGLYERENPGFVYTVFTKQKKTKKQRAEASLLRALACSVKEPHTGMQPTWVVTMATLLASLGAHRLQRQTSWFFGFDEATSAEYSENFAVRLACMLSEDPGDCMGRNAEIDLYSLLGVEPDASPRMIKRAYHVIASRLHPDKRPRRFAAMATQKAAMINYAYSVLKDPQLRREYDEQRNSRGRPEADETRRHRRDGPRLFGWLGNAAKSFGGAFGWLGNRVKRVTFAFAGVAALLARKWRGSHMPGGRSALAMAAKM